MRILLAVFVASLYSFANAQVYIPIDSASKISFKIKNFGSTVTGEFKGLKGLITFDANNLTNSKFETHLDAATIDTGISMRDNHLRKSDYFGIADFPTIRFISTKVGESGKINSALLTGLLTIKKHTKEISFPFNYSFSNGIVHFIGEFQINRRDFEVGGNSISLSDELTVLLDVRASK